MKVVPQDPAMSEPESGVCDTRFHSLFAIPHMGKRSWSSLFLIISEGEQGSRDLGFSGEEPRYGAFKKIYSDSDSLRLASVEIPVAGNKNKRISTIRC